jgi:alginate O-acetyltransferase complex protein AlgI
MLFNSLQFLLFFIAVTSLFFAFPHKARWALLLTASCIFYMAFVPVYILILGFTIVIDYIAGIQIEKATGKKRKQFLILSLIANIGVLAVFKYYNFFNDNLTAGLQYWGIENHMPYLKILLPIGLSFHTFQAMSYTFEVYRGNQKVERHFGIYALYVMFYPQLVAGPIERPQNILHQFHEKQEWDYERFKSGILLIFWGLFKKIVIADRLALIVDSVYNNPSNYTTPSIIIAIVFFSIQIYCDFSGYSDIAIGTARVMGFKLMENFRTPYFSKSIGEFWKRWHISLSSWFKDYLYIPLGGNKVSKLKMYRNIIIVFLVSGFWHGASWNFVIWGGLHAIFQVVGLLKKKYMPNLPKMPALVDVSSVFVLVSLAWIFFRIPTFNGAIDVFKGILSGNWTLKGINLNEAIFCILLITGLNVREYYMQLRLPDTMVKYFYPKVILYVIAIYFLAIFSDNQFIYFQF